MKHPVRSDFDSAVTEAGVNVTFKPTNSMHSFYRLPESEDAARLCPSHSGLSDTLDRVAIPRTILLMKFKTWHSVLLWKSQRPFGPSKTRKKLTD
jgi:hypothetical protein